MTKGPDTSPDVLITTAAWQPIDLLSRWIESGANVNASAAGQYGRTPLLTAVTSEAETAEALTLLLDHGADPNIGTTEGELPLDWAIYSGDQAKARVLGEHGAKRGSGPRREEIPPPVKGGIGDPRLALTRSVSRLFDAAPGFREKTNCISCHHNAMPALTAASTCAFHSAAVFGNIFQVGLIGAPMIRCNCGLTVSGTGIDRAGTSRAGGVCAKACAEAATMKTTESEQRS